MQSAKLSLRDHPSSTRKSRKRQLIEALQVLNRNSHAVSQMCNGISSWQRRQMNCIVIASEQHSNATN
jgi:hypothetical protein